MNLLYGLCLLVLLMLCRGGRPGNSSS